MSLYFIAREVTSLVLNFVCNGLRDTDHIFRLEQRHAHRDELVMRQSILPAASID